MTADEQAPSVGPVSRYIDTYIPGTYVHTCVPILALHVCSKVSA